MATIFKRGGKGSYIIQWFDATGRRREKSSRTTNGRGAQRLADKLEADVMLRREGIIDARQDRYSAANRKPLAEHLSEWRTAVLAKGDTVKHADLIHGPARRVMDGCGFTLWPDLSATTVTRSLPNCVTTEGIEMGIRASL